MTPQSELEVDQLSTVIEQHANKQRLRSVQSMFNNTSLFRAEMSLEGDTGEPEPDNIMDVIRKGKTAPATTSVAAIPPSISDMDLQNLQDVSLLDTYVSVASARYLYKQNPKGFDITTPNGASEFTTKLANARLLALTKGLAGVLSIGSSTASRLSKNMMAADLHLEFLTTIFSGFSFTPSAMKQLDGVLTNVVKALSNVQASWTSQSASLDHMISVYYFEKVEGLDVKVPKIRLFFLHVDQNSWKLAIGKSSVQAFTFNMNYSDQIGTMSLTQMTKSRDTIQGYITDMTNKSLDDMKEYTAMVAAPTK